MTALQIWQLLKRITPRLLGWNLGGLLLLLLLSPFTLSLLPDGHLANRLFACLLELGLLPLPWIAPYMAWQLADEVENPFWKANWRFLAVAGYAGALVSCLVGTFVLLFVAG